MIVYLSDKRKIIFGIASLCAGIVTISILTYHPSDPSLFFLTTSSVKILNWCGAIGAHISAALFFIFGSAALWLLILCWLFLYILFFQTLFIYRTYGIVGFGLLLIISMIEALHKISFVQHGFIFGGYVGNVLIRGLLYAFDEIVVVIMLYVSAYALIIIMLNFTGMYYVQQFLHILRWLFCEKMVLQKICASVYRCLKVITHAMITMLERLCFAQSIPQEEILPEEFQEFMQEYQQGDNAKVAPDQENKNDSELSSDTCQIPSMYEKGAEKNINKNTNSRAVEYELPSKNIFKIISLLDEDEVIMQEQQQLALRLEGKLQRFGIVGSVISIKTGPVVTLFEYQPHIDAKISKIMALEDDLALALEATSIRIIAPIPGTSVVGFEVARKTRQAVPIAGIIHSNEFNQYQGALPLILGVDTIGKPVIADLGSMPHLLVAGATGSGKSVALNVFLMSLLVRCIPHELKLVLIDPKRLEFAPYADIPHLLFPIVTQPRDAALALQWLITTMDARYETMAQCGVRNIADYNKVCFQYDLEPFYSIVLMIDEVADLMMITGKEIEDYIARLAQMARAAGIYLIIATQRPSVDVITGIIKANFPTRISFRVATKIDARTILDTVGAEKLLGKGDMLYLDVTSNLHRIHGAFVSDREIADSVSHIRAMQKVSYLDLPELIETKNASLDQADELLYQEVVAFLQTIDEISISLIQRKFKIGYNRSARIIEMLESQGHILSIPGSKMRKVMR